MEKREVVRKFSRTVPVIIESHENATKKTKLMVPSNYTAGHLVSVLRSRMHLLPYHPVYLFLKSKLSPVLMSKSIGHLHHKYRDEKGLLRLIHAGQASFGFRGNIRAIRFRQKWIENLHNSMQQDAGGPPTFSGGPPPYFPLEPPSTSNFGAPFGLVDDLNDSAEQLNTTDDDDEGFLVYTDSEGNFTLNYAHYTSLLLNNLNYPPPLQSSYAAGSSHSSALTITSTSSTLSNSSHSFSSDSDPWMPSASVPNSSQISGLDTISFFDSDQPNQPAGNSLDQFASETLCNICMSVSDLPTFSSANVQSPIDPSSQPLNVPIPQLPPLDQSLYESDSDFYDSDKDVDMDD